MLRGRFQALLSTEFWLLVQSTLRQLLQSRSPLSSPSPPSSSSCDNKFSSGQNNNTRSTTRHEYEMFMALLLCSCSAHSSLLQPLPFQRLSWIFSSSPSSSHSNRTNPLNPISQNHPISHSTQLLIRRSSSQEETKRRRRLPKTKEEVMTK